MASPEYTGVWRLLYDWQTLIVGVLMFAVAVGGVILNTKTPEDRQRIIFWITQLVIVALTIVAAGSLYLGYMMLALVLYSIVFMISLVGYIRNVARGNYTPLYLSLMSICLSVYASMIGVIGSTAFTKFIFDRQQQEIEALATVQEHAAKIQSQIIGVLDKVTSHSAEQYKLIDEMNELQLLQSNIMVLLGKRTSNSNHPRR